MKSTKPFSLRDELKGLAPLVIVTGLIIAVVYTAMSYREVFAPTHVEVTHAP